MSGPSNSAFMKPASLGIIYFIFSKSSSGLRPVLLFLSSTVFLFQEITINVSMRCVDAYIMLIRTLLILHVLIGRKQSSQAPCPCIPCIPTLLWSAIIMPSPVAEFLSSPLRAPLRRSLPHPLSLCPSCSCPQGSLSPALFRFPSP